VILLDTHVALWARAGERLKPKALRAIIAASLQRGGIGISAISIWETAMLAAKERITVDVDAFVRETFLRQDVLELPVTVGIGLRAGRLLDFHGDPADRILVATALENDITFLTRDERILKFAKKSGGTLRVIEA
jgi:PIN domain nuclease of toxin-antitoxin system